MNDDYPEDFRARERMRSQRVKQRACCDGMCGADDCYTCRGDAALRVIFPDDEPEQKDDE